MGEPREGDVIAVWFSSGAASAVAAKKTVERYGNLCTVRLVNHPVAEEDEDNRRFLADVEQWIGIKVERSTSRQFPNASAVEVWDNQRAMVFPAGAPCTRFLKRAAGDQWESENRPDWTVLGFTVDERRRHENFIKNNNPFVLPVLIDARLTKEDCFAILREASIELPRVYAMGYPNANCIGCVKATSPTYWNLVREKHPEVFAHRAEQSRRLGVPLVRVPPPPGEKRRRIFLDELSPTTKGRPLKTMKAVECGLFCEETAPTPRTKP